MATLPFKPKEAQPTPQEDPLLKEMKRLVARAEIDRGKHRSRIADCYRYTMPWRHQFDQTQVTPDLDIIFDGTAGIVLEDFAADMLNTFTPQKNNWVTAEPVEKLDSGQFNQVKDKLAAYQRVVFGSMARSNLYMALQEAYMDLGPGTMILQIKDIGATKPIHCEAIPAPEALLTKGPYGYVDGIFRKRKYFRSEIKTLWPDADLTQLGPEPAEGTDPEHEVTDGCWRDWKDLTDEVYHYCVQADSSKIYHKEYKGPGSCPFIAARWGRDSTTAWGCGPTYRSLPEIKTLNHVRYTDLKNYDKHVDPPTSYEDDGVVNLDQGVTPGTWIPRAPGSKPPEPIESKSRVDMAVFERDELRSMIRRAHYQDRPEQQGKTPPSATQWADEAAERARRMGTPATTLVHELQYPLFRRFAYLEGQRGMLPKVQLEGNEVALQPISPLLRAQEQEAVVRRDKFAELIVGRFGPQVGMIVVDIVEYAKAQGRDMGIEDKIIRNPDDIANAIKQFLPVLQNATAGRPGEIAPPGLGALSGGIPQ
ncbi:phage tail protein [Bradyrhizobium sp. 168]|uniref:portal protein n=1 Tax=Bradyrhizobium sp. 168 TaxID=2782639 RepID=UPI001FF86AAC|nr:portal protein [Bradyrhizobium sp. 168]MCK1585479.1 phage tail protein [Bradyrhizobium sp. 168]